MTDQEIQEIKKQGGDMVARVAALSNRVWALEEAVAYLYDTNGLSNRVKALEEDANALSKMVNDPCPKCEEVASLKRQLARRQGGD